MNRMTTTSENYRNMYLRKWIIALFCGICLTIFRNIGFAQKADSIQYFSLKSAKEYAVKHSYTLQTASKDIEKARKVVLQTTAIGLPQVNAKGSYQNFLDIPTQLMPDFLSPVVGGMLKGTYAQLIPLGVLTPQQYAALHFPEANPDNKFPVQFGQKFNASGEITATQLIFDGTYIVGLQASRIFVQLTQENYTKNEYQVRETVAQTYYLILVAQENLKILDSTLAVLQKLERETRIINKVGFAEDTDADQLQLLVSNLNNKKQMLLRQIEVAKNMLKFQMGLEINQKIELTDKLEDIVNTVIAENLDERKFDFQNHIDYKLASTNVHLNKLNLRKERFTYLPSIAMFFNVSRNAQRSSFDFFDSDKDWYKTSILGFQMTIPIFSSGMKHFKIQQNKLELEKSLLLQKQVQEGLQLEVLNARSTYKTYLEQYRHELDNMKLAKRIYDKSIIKFKEGVGSSMELSQNQNQYLTTQGNYFNTILELLNAHSKLNKALNNY